MYIIYYICILHPTNKLINRFLEDRHDSPLPSFDDDVFDGDFSLNDSNEVYFLTYFLFLKHLGVTAF